LDELDDIVYENRMKDVRAGSRALLIAGVEADRISRATLEAWEMQNGLRPCPHRNVDILVKRLDGSRHVQCWVCMETTTTYRQKHSISSTIEERAAYERAMAGAWRRIPRPFDIVRAALRIRNQQNASTND